MDRQEWDLIEGGEHMTFYGVCLCFLMEFVESIQPPCGKPAGKYSHLTGKPVGEYSHCTGNPLDTRRTPVTHCRPPYFPGKSRKNRARPPTTILSGSYRVLIGFLSGSYRVRFYCKNTMVSARDYWGLIGFLLGSYWVLIGFLLGPKFSPAPPVAVFFLQNSGPF